MIRFDCDYLEGAHPLILQKLSETNMEQTPGYGLDPHCERARELIKKECGKDVNVHFIVGGTQTNMIVLASLLKPYQGALCASTGHIEAHETGAIEATGHKVMTLPSSGFSASISFTVYLLSVIFSMLILYHKSRLFWNLISLHFVNYIAKYYINLL